MEYFADCYEGTNGDGYKHNFSSSSQTLHHSFHVLIFSIFPCSLRVTPWLNGHAISIIMRRSFPSYPQL